MLFPERPRRPTYPAGFKAYFKVTQDEVDFQQEIGYVERTYLPKRAKKPNPIALIERTTFYRPQFPILVAVAFLPVTQSQPDESPSQMAKLSLEVGRYDLGLKVSLNHPGISTDFYYTPHLVLREIKISLQDPKNTFVASEELEEVYLVHEERRAAAYGNSKDQPFFPESDEVQDFVFPKSKLTYTPR